MDFCKVSWLHEQVTRGHNIVADWWAGASNPPPHPIPPRKKKNHHGHLMILLSPFKISSMRKEDLFELLEGELAAETTVICFRNNLSIVVLTAEGGTGEPRFIGDI